MGFPLISFIITTHNRSNTLLRTIRSLVDNIKVEKEIIVLSDVMDLSSHNGLLSLLGPEDSIHFVPKLRGPSETRNLGVHLARGEFINLFDDDDEFPNFDSHYQYFLNDALNNRRNLTYANVFIGQENRADNGLSNADYYLHTLNNKDIDSIYLKNFILTPASLIPAYLAKQCLQDPFLRSLEDWDYLLNLKSRCDFSFSNHVGAIIYKDFINMGNRRSTMDNAKGLDIVLDYLYIYRRWPAPSNELCQLRSELLSHHGIKIPAEFL